MKVFLVVTIVCLLNAVNASAATSTSEAWKLTLAQWSGPKTAGSILRMKPIRDAVKAFDQTAGARLELLHNGGDSGVFWAANLKGWLISLGIPGSRILVHTGGLNPGVLEIKLLAPTVSKEP